MHELTIEGMIGSGFWGDISSKMIRDELQDKSGDLTVHLNSIGGDVFEGVAIMNQLRRYNGPVTVRVDGIAASIASVIAMGGDEVIMGTGSQFMIHAPWTATVGDEVDHQRARDALRSSKVSILDAYMTRTTAAREQVEAWVDAETWFTAAEAVDAGFADRVEGEDVQLAACLPKNLFRNTPEYLIADRSDLDVTAEVEAKLWQAVAMGMRAELLRRV